MLNGRSPRLNTARHVNLNPVIQAKVSGIELADFDALLLGLLLISHARGQVARLGIQVNDQVC